MTDLNRNMIKFINDISNNDIDFLDNMKRILSIKKICAILKINRNKYNYLVRNKQLNIELLKLRKVN